MSSSSLVFGGKELFLGRLTILIITYSDQKKVTPNESKTTDSSNILSNFRIFNFEVL